MADQEQQTDVNEQPADMDSQETADTESAAQNQTDQEEPPEDWGEDISPGKDGGVYKRILNEGVGKEKPLEGDEVFVHYTGRLLSGEVFDSSVKRNEIFKFKLGEGQVIKGWDVGVATMTKGEKCILTCRPENAYGKDGSPPSIPPDSTLRFEVELFQWQGEDITKDGGVFKSIVTKGDGYSKPRNGTVCNIHIRGTHEGQLFDERDVTFDYGEGVEQHLPPGLEKAIGEMKNTESARVNIQNPQYGFGEAGHPDLRMPPNAELSYAVRLNSFQSPKEPWDYESVEEKRAEAEQLKERGSAYFKADKFDLALMLYTRGTEVVSSTSIHKEEEVVVVKGIRVALHLNLAACHLKLKEPSLTLKECEEVLKVDESNVKAFFRRGQARQLLQDYEEAIADFQEVQKLEPRNKAASTHIAQCRHKIKAIHDQERKRYANMFERFAAQEMTETPPTKEEPKPETATDNGDVEKTEGEGGEEQEMGREKEEQEMGGEKEEQEMGGEKEEEEEEVNGEKAVGDIIMQDEGAVEA